MPRYDLIDSNRHGTRCAGEVAAEGNNSICAVGVAFGAGIGGTTMLSISLSLFVQSSRKRTCVECVPFKQILFWL